MTDVPLDERAPRGAVLDWIVFKVAQRCNLNCSYCYVYNRGDGSWRFRQPFVSENVIQALGSRIREHCTSHSLDHFVVELHGGEPLLLGKRRLDRLVTVLREECANIPLRFVMQTNGLLLDEDWLELFDRHSITFGLSLDGPPELADRFRVDHRGSGSTRELLRIVRTLRQAGPLFDRLNSGVLCVIDSDSDGAQIVRWFVAEGFNNFDFLLPLGNYANYPPSWGGAGPYLRFFLSAFEEWYNMGREAPRIRTFELMMRGLMGSRPQLDALGGDLKGLCVVESDGSIGVSDNMRICGPAFATDSLNVFDHPFDLHALHYRLDELQAPCATCHTCKFFVSCRGGYLPHRFDGVSFDNPSMYCSALYGLSQRMYERLREAIPSDLWREVALSSRILGAP